MQTEAHPKKRTGLTFGAWVAVVFGAVLVAAGGTGIWADTWKRDDNGYFAANAHRYQTHTRAIATESIKVGSYVPTWLAGNVRLDVSGDKPLFVGIAPKATVDAYLARIEHTEATRLDLDPFKVTYVDHAGAVDPGRPARGHPEAAVRADPARARGSRPDLRRAHQRGDRREAVSLRQDRGPPRFGGTRQAGRADPDRRQAHRPVGLTAEEFVPPGVPCGKSGRILYVPNPQ